MLSVSLFFISPPCLAECLAPQDTSQHIGATKCVRGKVFQVHDGARGVTFLDFCEDYRKCSFMVVIFARDLKRIGDVRYLQGKQIEVHGKIQEYDGRAEIILSRYQQLRGDAARIPPLPKDYDVEKRGRYSAGSFSRPHTGKPPRKRNRAPVTIEDPSSAGQED
jgi:hypothetical protein